MSTPLTGPLPHFDSTLGAAFLGHFVTTILYGITSLQAFIYYRQHPNDPPLMRFLVLVLWILDGVHIALITGSMYYYLITNFAHPAIVEKPVWSFMVMIIVGNVSNFIVRGVFGYRIWKLSGGALALPIIIGLLSIYVAVDAFYFAARGLRIQSYLEIHDFSWVLYMGFSFEATVDWIITIAQCLLLRRFQTGVRRADSVVQLLMAYSINTGLLTSVCALLALITFATLPSMFVYFAFYFILSKLYVNALLANLNARGHIADAMDRMAGGNRDNVHRTVHNHGGKDAPFDMGVASSTLEASASASQPTAGAQFTTILDDPMLLASISTPTHVVHV